MPTMRFFCTRSLQLLVDALVVAVALGLAYLMRFEGAIPREYLRGRVKFFVSGPVSVQQLPCHGIDLAARMSTPRRCQVQVSEPRRCDGRGRPAEL